MINEAQLQSPGTQSGDDLTVQKRSSSCGFGQAESYPGLIPQYSYLQNDSLWLPHGAVSSCK